MLMNLKERKVIFKQRISFFTKIKQNSSIHSQFPFELSNQLVIYTIFRPIFLLWFIMASLFLCLEVKNFGKAVFWNKLCRIFRFNMFKGYAQLKNSFVRKYLDVSLLFTSYSSKGYKRRYFVCVSQSTFLVNSSIEFISTKTSYPSDG